jgi:hypothetical protein
MRYLLVTVLITLVIVLAACGDDATDDEIVADDPEPTPTEEVAEEPTATPVTDPTTTPEPDATATPVPEATDDEVDEPEPTPTPEPAEDVDLAPELAGLTDWRNTDPTSLEQLRGQPVVLVFWNSL